MPYALIEDAWDQSNFIKKQYSELKEHKKKMIHNSSSNGEIKYQ